MGKVANSNGIQRGARAAQVINRVIPLAALTPHKRNYNRHSDAQIEDLRESLRQFGQVRSIVVRSDKAGKRFTVVAGHGIVEAARLEGFTELRADIIPHHWSETRVLAYLAADNELARHGDPDQDQLAAIVREVMELEGAALARLAAGEQVALDRLLNATNGKNDGNDASQKLGGLEYRVIVTCKDEAHQVELMERLEAEGLQCQALIS